MSDMTDKQADEMVDRAAEALGEHFDAVIILASRPHPDLPGFTQLIPHGRGNWFAQRGMMQDLLQSDQAKGLASKLKQEDGADGKD